MGSSSFHVIDKEYSNGTYGGFLDGTQVINGTGTTYNLGSTDTGIGRQFDTGTYYAGDIAEVVIFNSALSTTDRKSVESYLDSKYALAPEPATMGILSTVVFGLLAKRRRRV